MIKQSNIFTDDSSKHKEMLDDKEIITSDDILGKEVATLVNEEKTVGTYEVDFNASGLSSGVYFYQLKLGSFIKTNKMILMK